jgi:hypothetical protein
VGVICGTYGKTNSYGILVSMTNCVRPRRMWKDNIKMGKAYFECVVWIYLAQNRDKLQDFANTTINTSIRSP